MSDYEEVWSTSCLEGRVALVTGVSGGIGAEILRALVAVGARTYGLTRNPGVVTESRAVVLEADAGDEGDVRAAVGEVARREGRIDIAVANAARYTTCEISEISVDTWNDELRVNLTGPFVLFQAVAAVMREEETGGCMVAIGSTAGERGGTAGHVAYGASKSGLEGLCKGMAREVGRDGIRVNVLALGSVEGTGLSAEVKRIRGDAYGTAGPLGRPASVREAAQGVIFLASDASSFMTGSVIRMDGGALYSGR